MLRGEPWKLQSFLFSVTNTAKKVLSSRKLKSKTLDFNVEIWIAIVHKTQQKFERARDTGFILNMEVGLGQIHKAFQHLFG